jgi:hypothetical protein
MNLSSGRGPGQPWLRGTATLAAMMAALDPEARREFCLVLLAVCSGSPSAAASGTGGSTRVQGALAYARCMRSHGVPDFAEPDSPGNFNVPPGSVSSQETAANQVCNHLLNTDTQLSAARTQRTLGQLVKYSRCMRAHGVPGFPDPTTISGAIGEPGGFTFDTAGLNLDQRSPRHHAAQQACQRLATHAKG